MKKVLSNSLIFKNGRNYYKEIGSDAWENNIIPYRITNSAFIGKAYADMLFAIIKDYYLKNSDNYQPVYIVEVGSGHGKLAFYVLKFLEEQISYWYDEIQASSKMFVYVLADISEKNIEFCRKHEVFKPYINKQLVDFAVFDGEADQNLTLLESGKRIEKNSLKSPIILLGNYLFDALSNDVLYTTDNKLFAESLDEEALEILMEQGYTWDEIIKEKLFQYVSNEIDSDYFNDKYLSNILKAYKDNLNDATFNIPIGGIKVINNLRALSQNDMHAILSDFGTNKGFSHGKKAPWIHFYGSTPSLMVNFLAIELYFEQLGGFSMLSNDSSSLKTSLFSTGQIENYKNLHHAYSNVVRVFSPDDFQNLSIQVRKNPDNLSWGECVSFLKLGKYDPIILLRLCNRLISLICQNEHNSDTLIFIIEHTWDNFYLLGDDDIAVVIGKLLIALDMHKEAFKYFVHSIEYHGLNKAALCGLGLCSKVKDLDLNEHETNNQLIKEFNLDRVPTTEELNTILFGSKLVEEFPNKFKV